ncbi:MAG TPA: phosphate ABC transporter substrate-binding protein PstS [Gemmata sp.]|jgi:phosphate transport system substrate-binding protein|nr:phosphate ABC transporter substrate-binding protein PstS [Gemmata sp.]
MPTRRLSLAAGLFILGLPLMAGCGNGGAQAPRINAGGATFVNPIMQKWSGEYKTRKNVEIDYVSKGSGYGVEQMTAKTIDFGCSDAPMSKEQAAAAKEKGGDVIHVPLIMGAVAVVYNVPGVNAPIKLTGDILADIYRKDITKWDHPRITALNPGMPPGKDIVVVARAEKSGTTNIFTEYLSKASGSFQAAIGTSTKPKWPKDVVLQEQNDGVAGFVKNNEYTIGYVEVLFAKKNDLKTILLKNKAGEYVGPNADGAVAAAEEAMKIKPTEEPYSLHELTYSLTDAAGAKSYPICGISYGILFAKLPKDKGPTIVEFLKWAVTDGQQFAKELEYAPLPADLQKKVQERLGQVTFE